MAPELVIPAQNGGHLKLSNIGPEELMVSVESSAFSGATTGSVYHVGPPVAFFRDLADSWRGWEGERFWGDIDGVIELRATSDSTGHISLRVILRDATYYARSIDVLLVLEAGQMEELARSVSKLFAAS